MGDPTAGGTVGLDQRVRNLELIQEIHAFVSAFCAVIDGLGPASRLVPYFADDVVLTHGKSGEGREGRDAVLSHYDSFFGSGATFARHLPINPVVTIEHDGSARYRSSFMAVIGYPGVSMLSFGDYADRIERRDGCWVYVEKRNTIAKVIKVRDERSAATGQDVRSHPANSRESGATR